MGINEEELLADIINRIQVFVFPRRIRVREFFKDYDPLRCGRCTASQFQRVLKSIGVVLSEHEVALLSDHFTENGPRVVKPQEVSYDAFCLEVDTIFATRNLEGDPASPVASPGSTLRTTFNHNEVQDEDLLLHALHKLAMLCKTRGVMLNKAFKVLGTSSAGNNWAKNGKVNERQFNRNFPFIKEMSPEEIQVIIDRYRVDAPGIPDVHYQQLHDDVSEVMHADPPDFPKSPLYLRPDPHTWDHHSLHVVQKVQSKVVERRVRLIDSFYDFDPLRKGRCTASQVKTVFTILNLDKEITRDDFENLVAIYAIGDGLDSGMFNYAAFCQDVNSAFTTQGLEKDPLAQISMPDAGTTAPARRNRIQVPPQRRAEINLIEDKIRQRVRTRRINIKPAFQSIDPINTGHVTKNQFLRTMGNLGFELTQEQVQALAELYCDLGNHHDFNYKDFALSVDPPDEDIKTAEIQMNSAFAEKKHKYFNMKGQVYPIDIA
eukprot:gnl/TRDRNA2_/TRDRNA2_179447_c0_seq1.p1 gnl/TRDRNA2_/TRDRNA2_179447_c0~~gnl/TRDRNA2_/TRDRNA2_179447_c0_seq1.p1  ORF type:complete len:490 (-),score=99.94 gnl/TRDRNA2_/TRDRNA2_179447_c0_seq1:13-1482(-)